MNTPSDKPKRKRKLALTVNFWWAVIGINVLLFLCLIISNWHLALFALVPIVLGAGMVGYCLIPMLWASAKLNSGDYAGAFQRAEIYRTIPGMERPAQLFEGQVMLFSGHYDKAEVLFREQLAQHRLHYMAHEDIGYSLLRQGRYDEAVRCFQAVITAAPENAYAYAGLAETYLELGQNPVYALDLTVTAARLKDENWLARIMARHHWANIYGTQAWAYAQLGERVEAENAIQLGLMKTNRHFKPGVAGLYYRAGRAMQALADIAKAREYWQLGYQLDSMGGYGNLAGEALVALEAQQASISAVSR